MKDLLVARDVFDRVTNELERVNASLRADDITALVAVARQELTHTTDADCTLDANDSCVWCGVYHGHPCSNCGGRGFHTIEVCQACGACGRHYDDCRMVLDCP